MQAHASPGPAFASTATPAALPEGVRGHYQLADTSLTLREGLAEYYRVNPGLSDPDTMSNRKSAHYFRCHDATHVVFGTNTSLRDEMVNDLLTFFGVATRIRDYIGGFFATDESVTISKSFFTSETMSVVGATFKEFGAIRRHAKTMTKKWPWAPPPELMDRPLQEIRSEYGIRIYRDTR